MNSFKRDIYNFLLNAGVAEETARYLNLFVMLFALLILIFIIDFIKNYS